jgi:uncharacterized membrane protein YheB (UPF0754 family)
MASVRLTRELRDEIYTNATNAFKIANPEPIASTAFEQKLRAAIPRMPSQEALAEAKTILNSVFDRNNSTFDNKHFHIVERSISKADVFIPEQFQRRLTVTVKFSAPIHIFGKKYESYYGPEDDILIEDFSESDKSEITNYVNDLVQRKKEHRNKSIDYEQKIRELLDKCGTLKQLLEVWPAAETLVPPHKISRMHEKITRKQRAAQVHDEISFNADEFNQVVLTAKLMGA